MAEPRLYPVSAVRLDQTAHDFIFCQISDGQGKKINDKKTIIQGIALIPAVPDPDLQTAESFNTICLALLFCVLMFMGGLSYKFIGTVLAITIPTAVILFVIVIQPNQPLIHQYQQNRILAWLEPEEYESEEAYQQLNSIKAIGSGKLTGKGYNSDATTSVKNGNFISEPQTDLFLQLSKKNWDLWVVVSS